MIVSGHVTEIVEFDKPVVIGRNSSNALGRSIMASEVDKESTRYKTLRTAHQTLRRLINANVDAWGCTPKFVTLTFADNVQDIKTANHEFGKFRRRLEYELKFKVKYAVVIEFQKRGAIHYHSVFFNLPYIKNSRLAEIWENGFVRINKIDDVDNVGAYVTKYMTKEAQDKAKADRLIGQKSYFTSRGLKKPVESTDEKEIEQVTAALSHSKVFESYFENDYLGTIHYTQFNLLR